MVKVNIKIIVQGKSENSDAFAKRIEERVLLEVRKASEKSVVKKPSILMTSASDGRQTATFTFQTEEDTKI